MESSPEQEERPEPDEGASEEGASPPAKSLKSRAIKGTLLSVANVGGVQILRLAGNLITTRLLFPEAYGLMGLVLVLNQGLQMISDVGIVPNIIQHERGEERSFLNTAWTIQFIRGAGLSVIALAVAWPYAQVYGEPELFPLILVASVQGIISGLDSTKLATLNRRIELGRLVFVNITGQVVTLAVMVTWAYLARNVWALLGGAIAGDVTRMILSHVALPGENNRFSWEKDAARVIFDFGKWIFLSSLVTYVGMRFDSIALGKLIELDTFGIYTVGQNLAGLPQLVTGQIVLWVLLPALSESFRDDEAAFGENVRNARRVMNASGVLMVLATALGAPAFFWLLYDERYHDAGWMVQLLMLNTWFFFLQETSIRVQLAMGDSRSQMIANVAKLGGTIPAALIGFWLGQLPGLILGVTGGSLVGYATVARGLKKKGIPIFVSDLKWTVLGVVLGVAGGYTPWLLGPVVGVDPQLLSIGVGAAILIPYGAWAGRLVLREIRARRG
ncbi:MAG TPA: oligosaccharide flippase family protein [Sandaracinaceae bacterium LLY-WYZ-13_1]|nr:oligosaccharide flippase family protein [Sandaracinaceae bacterium LLY-WYZ-13_1]